MGSRDGEEPKPLATSDQQPATRAAGKLPLDQQVGQLLVSSFDGQSLPPYLRRRLRAGQTAGIVLFGRNIASAEQLRSLTGAVQRLAGGTALLAADQEGGSIRIVPFAGPATGQSEQRDPATAGSLARDAAATLRRLGVNVTLAPVADVASGPATVIAGRGFPGDSAGVAALVRASVKGWLRGRVAPTAKHFPGFGSAAVNTDDGPVTITRSRSSLEGDLRPFRSAIAAGVPLLMASHATYTAYDPRRIASQSPVLLRTLLRDRLGFEGAVMTDSLEADAVQRRSPVGVAAERSIAAGADVVLLTGSASWNLAYPRLLARARRSPRFRRRVGEAAARVLRLKRSLGLRVPRG